MIRTPVELPACAPGLPVAVGDWLAHPCDRTGERRHSERTAQRARAGFTLVELLVVIAVIALLAALFLPALSHTHEHARRSACLSNLRQPEQAHLLYLQDWDERFPNWWELGSPSPPRVGLYHFWTDDLQPYLRSRAILRDPQAAGPGAEDGELLADYVLATWGPGGRGTREDPHWRWAGPPLGVAEVARPTETVTLMDGYTTTGSATGWVVRHGVGLNAAFVDGHARWVEPRDFWRVEPDGRGTYRLHYAAADR